MPGGRNGPVADEVAFGGSWAIAVWAEVKADPFNTVKEEVTFLGVER